MEPETPLPGEPISPQPTEALARARICGFWSRVFALLIDSILLGVVGLVLGLIFFRFFVGLGGWGRLLGLLIAAPYFVILNSSLGHGQTIGKRLMKVRVVNGLGETVSLGRSTVRYLLLDLPYFLNGAMLPLSWMQSVVQFVLAMIVFGGGFAIVYLYVFNRKTRQSLHDLAAGTYVVDASSKGAVEAAPVWKGHAIVVGAWVAVLVALMVFVLPKIAGMSPFPELTAIQQRLLESSKAQSVSVFKGKVWGPGGERKYLTVTAVWTESATDYSEPALRLAATVLEVDPSLVDQDVIRIVIVYGYDIGIARASMSYAEQHSPREWQEKLAQVQGSEQP